MKIYYKHRVLGIHSAFRDDKSLIEYIMPKERLTKKTRSFVLKWKIHTQFIPVRIRIPYIKESNSSTTRLCSRTRAESKWWEREQLSIEFIGGFSHSTKLALWRDWIVKYLQCSCRLGNFLSFLELVEYDCGSGLSNLTWWQWNLNPKENCSSGITLLTENSNRHQMAATASHSTLKTYTNFFGF